MPYANEGTLETDTREVSISEGWDTQTEWEAYQSLDGIDITNGVITLAETSTIPSSGIARWTFDTADTETDTAIDVWNGNNGTISQDVTTGQTGANQTYTTNESYQFINGGSSKVDYPSLSVSGSITVGCWAYRDSVSDQWLISNRGSGDHYTLGFGFGTDSANAVFVIGNGSSDITVTDTEDVSSGSWVHLVGVYDTTNGEIRIYKNSILMDTVSTTLSVSPTSNGTISGEPNGNFQLNGRIDDPRIYDKALSDVEIIEWYDTGSIQ